MTDETGRLVLVTGARAAGKTAVAHALARYLPRAVHLDGEVLAGFVVTGSAPAVLPLSRDALEQVYLRWSAAIAVAETYQRAGFDVVVSDSVVGDLFADFVDFVSPEPLHVVMLAPTLATLRAREQARGRRDGHDPRGARDQRDPADSATFETLAASVAQTPRVGLWLDTSGMSLQVTVAQILGRLGEARIDTTEPLASA